MHWNVNVVAALSGSVRPLPESVPEFDQGPPAVQLVALFEPQESVDRPPEATGFGEAVSDAVGALAAAWLAEQVGLEEPPFVPEQVHETELPADGNDVLVDAPFAHCVYEP